jgi:integrase
MVAAMAKPGLRVMEMCRLGWRDVAVHDERLVIDEAKTDAGNRHVELSLDVMEELMAWRAERQPALTRRVRVPDRHRPAARSRTGRKACERAPGRARPPARAEADNTPLRRTYISLMIEAGAPLPCVMSQVGHADSRTTLEIYT